MNTDAGLRFIDAATIQERIDDIEVLERRLHEDPYDQIASSNLEAIYRNRGDWTGLIQLLLDRAELLATPRENAALLREVARIYMERMQDADAALVVLHTAFSNDPTSEGIADAIDQAAYATGEWADVIDKYILAAASLVDDHPYIASDLWLRVCCAMIVTNADWESVSDALDRVTMLDPGRARAYLDMVESMGNTPEILETLAVVCARIEDFDRMARALSRAVAICTDRRYRAKLHHQIAELNRALGDEATAEWHFNEALRLDESRADTREALTVLLKSKGEFRRAAELLEHQRAAVVDEKEKAALGYEAASLYQELDENTRAIDLCRATLEVDPDHAGAALPLAERYWQEQRWQELEPIIEMLLRKDSFSPAWQVLGELEMYYRAAHCAKELGKFSQARDRYESAIDADSVHLPSLLECAEVYCELSEWQKAYDTFNAALIVQRGISKSNNDFARTLYRMGQTRRACGDIDAALTLYESAMDVGDCTDALEAATELYVERGDYPAVVQSKQRQLESAPEEKRVELLTEIASITSRKLGDPHAAMEMYREVLRQDAENREALHQLVEHYSAAEMWDAAKATILSIAELEPEAIRRGKYYQAAGTICRHHLDGDEAVKHLNAALDCFFLEADDLKKSLRAGCMKAFADIGRVLYTRGEWKKLERCYRQMIKRLKPEDSELAELWHGLGQVYRKHLGHRESAINSFEVASKLDHKRQTNHRILIDLYAEAGVDKIDKAIERRYRLLNSHPLEPDHYKALRSLFLKTKDYDRVWCACRALEYLGAADTKEREFYRRRKPEGILWPTSPMTNDMWALIRSDKENPRISEMLGQVADVAAYESSTTARKLGLRDDESPAFNHLRRLFASVTYALGVRQVDVFVQPQMHGDMLLANLKKGKELRPAFALGRSLFEGESVRSIVHSLARMLTYLRPQYYLRLSMSTSAELESVFYAASSLSRSDVPVPPQLMSWVHNYSTALRKRLHPQWQGQLARTVEAFVREGRPYNLEEWGYAVDTTARRVGLLLTGDLETAIAGFAREPLFTAGPNQEDKVNDLLIHSVSEAHFSLREKLGIGIRKKKS